MNLKIDFKSKEKFFILFLFVIFYLYLKILYPAFAINDSPETITAIYTLGISHPPGYPLYTMAGKIFLTLKTGSPAFNSNLFSLILGLFSLLLLFFILKYLYKESLIVFSGILFFPFVYGFLKETIQAKGGIYILNLIFLELIILNILWLLKEYSIKKIYLLFFIYTLSLSNHWQTMIFFLPVIIYFFIIYIKKINAKNYFFILFFIFSGITPYIFLLIRASSGVVLNHGDPSNFINLIKHILRINYSGEFASFNRSILFFQIKEFFYVWTESYGVLILLFFIELFYVFKNKDKILIILFLFFLINVLAVVFFFRRQQDSSCYYLPAIFVSAIFISGFLKNIFNIEKKLKVLSFAIIFLIAILILIKNYRFMNNSKNFLSYDYINNIYKTIDSGSIYIGSSDFDITPIFYMKYVLKKRKDLKIIFLNFLSFDWGVKQFKKDFKDFQGELELKKSGKNIINIIKYYYEHANIYAGYNYETVQKINMPHIQTGLIMATGKKVKEKVNINYFKIYSYREIFNNNYKKTGDTFRLISNYAGNMVNYGNEFLKNGNLDKAIELYESAVKLPFNRSKKIFYHNLYIAYTKKGDLKKAQEYYEKKERTK